MFYYIANIFDLHTFDNETIVLLIFFDFLLISTGIHCFFVFLNESNIATSLLMINLKYTVVHYANLNSISMNKPYLGAAE